MVEHDIIVSGLLGKESSPTILKRTDQEFIQAVLGELAENRGIDVSDASIMNGSESNKSLKLFQPVHRTFHVALVEAACDTFGYPRLDPLRIEGAGLVIRRISKKAVESGEKRKKNENQGEQLEGWMKTENSLRGWVKLNNRHDDDLDPDPEYRIPDQSSGNNEIIRLLENERRYANKHAGIPEMSESYSPLFAAPPDVCEKTGRTVLYGVVPTASMEMSEADYIGEDFDSAGFDSLLPDFFKQASDTDLPYKNQTLSATNVSDATLKKFIQMVHLFSVSLNTFEDSSEALALKTELNKIVLYYNDGISINAGDFLEKASEVFLEENSSTIKMAEQWPVISSNLRNSIKHAMTTCIKKRLSVLDKGQTRYSDSTRFYRLRVFVRVRHKKGCPPRTIWSDYSGPFEIAPWYDSSDAAPVQVSLPDALSPNFFKKVKPNVAFRVPEKLYNFLQGFAPEKLLDGEDVGKGDGKINLDWICCLNIPIITLCAFIVLMIFLQLLNIIFWWLPFIKICIPIPRKE